MNLHKYRVDFGPVEIHGEDVPGFFTPAYTWTKRHALLLAELDGHPLNTVTNRWTGEKVL